MSKIILKRLLSTSLVTSVLFLAGCEWDSDKPRWGEIKESTASQQPTTATDYNAFKSGLITPETLTDYIDDWENNKPAGVTGRLVIVQAGAASGNKFIKSNGNDIVTYQIPAGGACDPSYMRHDGVANIPGALLSGDRMDGMINAFHLDPEKDLVVFAVGKGSTTMRDVVRSVWSMNYWGWNHDRLAILNGSVDYDFSASSGLSAYLVDAPTTPPATPSTFTVKTLHTDRTNLHIYIDDMMKIAGLDDKTGYFIADARGTDEYSGVKKSKTADKNCAATHDQQCYSPYQGHIRDAVDFPYTELLKLDDQQEDVNGDGTVDKNDASFKFKSPAELEALFAEKGYKQGDKVVTYCRTGRKATLLTYVSDFILDYDAVMYDGSWIQWGEMANREDVNGSTILADGNKWITDDPKYSVNLGYTDPIDTQSAAPYDINSSATSGQKVKLEDQAYLQ